MNYKLIAYASDFVSFLLQELGKDAEKITQIMLFGSVARGEEGKQSDIDIFVDVSDQRIEKSIIRIKDQFFQSVKVTKYWLLLGVQREFHCLVGKLKEWDELERSIMANGIVLYGKYLGKMGTKPFFLFVVTPGKSRKKNVATWRKLYGYTQRVGRKVYEQKGLIRQYDGKKFGKGVFIIPIEHAQKIRSYLHKEKFTVEIVPFMMEVS